ncbi:MAG: 16S rRNA (cytidine(1402)-2'-O)-methyltransferase [Burkholderiales bacterium]
MLPYSVAMNMISPDAKGTLYVVATPIGNLRDITLRALDILKSVDVVAAEDTRTTSGLLKHYGISVRLVSLHQHNEREKSEVVLAHLGEGKQVALVSDAGTPTISDPGSHLVASARNAGFAVVPIPGPNAAITALSASGMSENGFLFYGFLPAKSSARKKALEPLKTLPQTLVFFEAPHRIMDLAGDLSEVLGEERTVVFARELTKLYETIHSCLLGEAGQWLSSQQKGEFVVIVEGANPVKEEGMSDEAKRVLEILLPDLPLAQAVKLAARISGENRNSLYELALELRGPD